MKGHTALSTGRSMINVEREVRIEAHQNVIDVSGSIFALLPSGKWVEAKASVLWSTPAS